MKGLKLATLLAALYSITGYAATSSTVINPFAKKGNELELSLGSKYANLESKLNSAQLYQVQLGAESTLKITSTLKFKLDLALNLESGNSDSLYDNNPLEANNDFSLKEASFTYRPLSFLKLDAGAINLKKFKHELLFRNTAYLGAKETLMYKTKGFVAQLSALQAAPHNRNVSNRLDSVDEGNPAFYMESLMLGLKYKNLKLKSYTSSFAYDNLSNSVAAESLLLGNSAYRTDRDNAEFVYSYIGLAQTLEASLRFRKFKTMVRAEYLRNDSAPTNNIARLGAAEMTYVVNRYKIGIGYGIHEIEADANVAYYMSSALGSVNSQGQRSMISFEDTRNDLELELAIGSNRELVANQLEDRVSEDYFVVDIRKSYDIF